jgi:hypothetical protein
MRNAFHNVLFQLLVRLGKDLATQECDAKDSGDQKTKNIILEEENSDSHKNGTLHNCKNFPEEVGSPKRAGKDSSHSF